jgi:hypothetical protein
MKYKITSSKNKQTNGVSVNYVNAHSVDEALLKINEQYLFHTARDIRSIVSVE